MDANDYMLQHRGLILCALRSMVTITGEWTNASQTFRRAEAQVLAAEQMESATAYIEHHGPSLLYTLEWFQDHYRWYWKPDEPDITNPEHRLYYAWGGKSDWPEKYDSYAWAAAVRDLKELLGPSRATPSGTAEGGNGSLPAE